LSNKVVISLLAAAHLAATGWHGDAHTRLAVNLPPGKNVFVYVVILIAPIVSAGLVWTRLGVIGLYGFVLSMLGAFLFGVFHHYVMISPDNIGRLPAGSPEAHDQFIHSAAAIALLELASAIYGAYCLGKRQALGRARA
jgi:hypothetical protein